MAGNIRQQFFEDVNSRNCGWNPSTAKWKLTKPKKASYQFWQILSQCVQNFGKLGSAQYLSLLVFLLDYSINSINYAQSPLLSVRLPKLPCWRYKENLLLFFKSLSFPQCNSLGLCLCLGSTKHHDTLIQYVISILFYSTSFLLQNIWCSATDLSDWLAILLYFLQYFLLSLPFP